MKDLKINLDTKYALDQFHPSSYQLYNITYDLELVCNTCKDPNYKYNGSQLKLNNCIKPMLAQVAGKKGMGLIRAGGYLVEPKYDGERMLIHVDVYNHTVKYCTRKGNDYTKLYGPKFTDVIWKCIDETQCKNVILDGEFMIWRNDWHKFKKFGYNKCLALNPIKDDKEQYCYVMFDVLYLNNKSIIDKNIVYRRKQLCKIVKEIKHSFEIVEQEEISPWDCTNENIVKRLKGLLEKGYEGLVCKHKYSKYIPNERGNKWLKIKPDHIDGLGHTLDLIVLGGCFGTKFGKNGISHFLLGVKKHSDRNDEYLAFCRIGTGYNNKELDILRRKLEPYWIKYDRNKTYDFMGEWKPTKYIAPDVIINPINSVVFEVKAFSIEPTTRYNSGFTLRFPRVLHIRLDKTYQDCNSLDDIQKIMSGEKFILSATKISMFNDKVKPNIKRTNKGGILPWFLGVDQSKIKVNNDIFKDYIFNVMIYNIDLKHKVEKAILTNGGKITQNYSRKKDKGRQFVITSKDEINTIKCNNFVKIMNKEIVNYEWILTCVLKNKLLQICSPDLLYEPEGWRRPSMNIKKEIVKNKTIIIEKEEKKKEMTEDEILDFLIS